MARALRFFDVLIEFLQIDLQESETSQPLYEGKEANQGDSDNLNEHIF
jgi:hypothetical protein